MTHSDTTASVRKNSGGPSRRRVHLSMLLAAISPHLLAIFSGMLGIVGAAFLRRILLSPVPIDGWRNLELCVAFVLAIWGLMFSLVFTLFCFRPRAARRAKPGVGPGLPVTRHEAPALFATADKLARELQISQLPEFRADLGGAILCPGQFVPNPGFLQLVMLGLPALAVLPIVDFTEVLRTQIRLTGISVGLRVRVAGLYGRIDAAEKRSGRKGVLWPVHRLCLHALQMVSAYYVKGRTEPASAVSDRVGREFTRYSIDHVNPLVATGHFPPVTDGFRRHWNSLDGVNSSAGAALSLIDSARVLEERLTNALIAQQVGLQRISWEQSSTILLNSWLDSAAHVPEPIRELKCGDVAGIDLLELGHRIYDQPGRLYDRTQLRAKVCRDIAVALVAAITKAGWRFDYDGPGTTYQFSRNSWTVLPFSMADGFLRGDGSESWRSVCAETGIADLQLG